MRQQVNSGERFRRGNAIPILIVAQQNRGMSMSEVRKYVVRLAAEERHTLEAVIYKGLSGKMAE